MIDAGFVAWLKAQARYVTASDAAVTGRWGDKTVTSERISPLALEADALVEAARQAGFLGGPTVRDSHLVPGKRSDLFGKPVRFKIDRLGYGGAGAVGYVIRAQEAETGDSTTLTVLRKL